MSNSDPFNTTEFNALGGEGSSEYNDVISEDIHLLDTLPEFYNDTITEQVNAFLNMSNFHDFLDESPTVVDTLDTLQSTGIVNSMNVSSSIASSLIISIVESVLVDHTTNSDATLNASFNDVVTLTDTIRLVFSSVIENTITTDDTLQDVIRKIATIQDQCRTSSTLSSVATLNSIISASMAVSALLNLNVSAEVLEDNINLSDELIGLRNAVEALLELIEINDVQNDFVKISVITTESINLDDLSLLNFNYNSSIEEEIVFIVTHKSGDKVYQAYSYYPESFGVTEYSNFNFNSVTYFNNQYLLANSKGLFRLGGKMDDEAFIKAKIKTATLDFESSSIKQVPKMYLGVTNDASLILSVTVDGSYKAKYKLIVDSNDLSTQMFDIGKGLKGRYWQFAIETDGNTDFDLDEIELYPVTFGRKV